MLTHVVWRRTFAQRENALRLAANATSVVLAHHRYRTRSGVETHFSDSISEERERTTFYSPCGAYDQKQINHRKRSRSEKIKQEVVDNWARGATGVMMKKKRSSFL